MCIVIEVGNFVAILSPQNTYKPVHLMSQLQLAVQDNISNGKRLVLSEFTVISQHLKSDSGNQNQKKTTFAVATLSPHVHKGLMLFFAKG